MDGLEIRETDRADNLSSGEPGQPDASSELQKAAVAGENVCGQPGGTGAEKPACENSGRGPQHLANVLLGVEAL